MADQFKIAEIQPCSCGKLPRFHTGRNTDIQDVICLKCGCGWRTLRTIEEKNWIDLYAEEKETENVARINVIDAWNSGDVYIDCPKCKQPISKGGTNGENSSTPKVLLTY